MRLDDGNDAQQRLFRHKKQHVPILEYRQFRALNLVSHLSLLMEVLQLLWVLIQLEVLKLCVVIHLLMVLLLMPMKR